MKFLPFLDHLLLLLSTLCFYPVFSATSTDTLTPSNSLSTNQTLISSTSKFELGFFTKSTFANYYVGIWYKDTPNTERTIIWVANRDSPSDTDSAILKLDANTSNLIILDDGSPPIWGSSVHSKATNPVLQLLDSGNLVIREAEDPNPDNYIWQSFDFPTDTLVPGQKLGVNLQTGQNRFLNSWNAPDDPGTGNFSFKMDYYYSDPEIFLWDGDHVIYRSAEWAGQRFNGTLERETSELGFDFVFKPGPVEFYYSFEIAKDEKVKSRLMVTYDGIIQRMTLSPGSSTWYRYWYARKDQCDYYRFCGAFGICNSSDLNVCECPPGFEPANPRAWDLRDASNGCVRSTKLECENDGFYKLVNMKLPESSNGIVNSNISWDECREMCKRNCSCTAYANSVSVQKVGYCVIWTGELIDMRDYVEGGHDLYIRMAASDLGASHSWTYKHVAGNSRRMVTVIVVVIPTTMAILMLIRDIWIYKRKRDTLHEISNQNGKETLTVDMEEIRSVKSLEYNINTIKAATHNFSNDNKLGEGGFGEVYKGKFGNGQEVAIKRLSKNSRQGMIEFKTEVTLVAKLQHKNLVKLLGFCVTSEEKILVYEYLPNSSLDRILFDPTKGAAMDWKTRFKIILGIAKGLQYLHEDSCLKIIHRDLKSSNILLDEAMQPKISDFGLAKLFGVDQTQGDTKRIVGTYGYMAPEYAISSYFSVKSDVFSFGVLVLEIVSGKKNKIFGRPDVEEALLHRAWKLWEEEATLDFVDASLDKKYEKEVRRCIHIGLLCIQVDANDRPRMTSVVGALNGQIIDLPTPKPPHYFGKMTQTGTSSSSPNNMDNKAHTGTENITDLYPR